MSRFERKLTNMKITTIGFKNQEIPTLGAVIANTISCSWGMGEKISGNMEQYYFTEKIWGIPVTGISVGYETFNRSYTHEECLSLEEQVKEMIGEQFDCAVLVVDAGTGITSDIKEQVLLARKTGVEYIVPFIDNCDALSDVEDVVERLEWEIQELLTEFEYPGEDTPIVYGSARGAWEEPESDWGEKILELLDILDEYVPEPEMDCYCPFVMPVEDVFGITGRGTVATGRVEKGVIKINDRVEIVGFDQEGFTATVTGIEMFRKLMDTAEPGDNVGLLLRGIEPEQIKRGHVISRLGACKSDTTFRACIYLDAKEEIGYPADGFETVFIIRTAGMPGRLLDVNQLAGGQCIEATVELEHSLAIEPGLVFAVRDNDKNVIGMGIISEN